MHNDKFIPGFIKLLQERFDFENHLFFVFDHDEKYPLPECKNIIIADQAFGSDKLAKIALLFRMLSAGKVVFHSLRLHKVLFYVPWLLRKSYWIIWGCDLYPEPDSETPGNSRDLYIKRSVISRIGHIVTYLEQDYINACQWYKAKGRHIKCFAYPSNTFPAAKADHQVNKGYLNILVGNSADPSNAHQAVFDQLAGLDDGKMHVYTPLAYGQSDYRELIEKSGQSLFGDRFHSQRELMGSADYFEFLKTIDIAVFNHRRQQAYGNSIILLGLGKKIFFNRESPVYQYLIKNDYAVFDNVNLELETLCDEDVDINISKVKSEYSIDSLVKSLADWIE